MGSKLVPKLLNERKPYNYSHHINDFHSETPELGKLYLNDNNIFYLNNKGVGYDNFNDAIKYRLNCIKEIK